MNWAIGIDMYTLLCIKWIPNKNLLYKKKTEKKKESVKHFKDGSDLIRFSFLFFNLFLFLFFSDFHF